MGFPGDYPIIATTKGYLTALWFVAGRNGVVHYPNRAVYRYKDGQPYGEAFIERVRRKWQLTNLEIYK
jgi:hypothetical protein